MLSPRKKALVAKMNSSLNKKLTAEFLGTALLVTIVVGSGIMGEQLAQGNPAIALLANSLATGAGLVVLILTLGSISGAHFNPAVSLVEALRGNLSKKVGILYGVIQFCGAFSGLVIAHLMFEKNILSLSEHSRSGPAQWLSEVVATFGLVAVIRGVGRNHKSEVPIAVGLYILSAYWFTSSTSFANPAVTLARAFTSTFTGIRLVDVVPFILAQLIGALAAEFLFRYFENQGNFQKELGT